MSRATSISPAHSASIRHRASCTPHGEPQALPSRPIHTSVDKSGDYLLTAYNDPSNVTVHRIKSDGTLGDAVSQPGKPDAGIYGHQLRTTPGNQTAILVSRGNNAAGGKPEDPGALKLYAFKDGALTNLASIAPGNGLGFGPRHLDFHPTQPWVYVSIERQNKLYVYQLQPDGGLGREPIFIKDTLADPGNEKPAQGAGPIHVHPNGRFVYVTNRNQGEVDVEGKKVFNGGENNVAVFAIDEQSGEPKLIQTIDGHGIHLRTFGIDPSGRLLVATSIRPMPLRDGKTLTDGHHGLSHRRRRQARVRAQIRRRHRQRSAVLERHGHAGLASHSERPLAGRDRADLAVERPANWPLLNDGPTAGGTSRRSIPSRDWRHAWHRRRDPAARSHAPRRCAPRAGKPLGSSASRPRWRR